MNKKIVYVLIGFIIFVIAGTSVFMSFQKDTENSAAPLETYSVNGGNEDLQINNGKIEIIGDKIHYTHGELVFINELIEVKVMNQKAFYYKNGEKHFLVQNALGREDSKEGMNILGINTNSSATIDHKEDMNELLHTLNYTVYGTYMNGEKFEYNLILDAQKVDETNI